MAHLLHGAVVAFKEVEDRYEYGLVVTHDESQGSCTLQLGSRDETADVALDQLVPVDEKCLDGVEDMSQFGVLNEATICLNLQSRYESDVIYTNIGDILVSVNPCKELPIFSRESLQAYMVDPKELKQLPAHIYSVAGRAYGALVDTATDQACIISGESGAGEWSCSAVLVYKCHTASRVFSCKRIALLGH